MEHFLEFGLGKGTSYFLQNCAEVTSVELVPMDCNGNYRGDMLRWFDYCKELYQNCANWQSILYRVGKHLSDANLIAINKHPTMTESNSAYKDEIRSICDTYVPQDKYDLVFVDAGIHQRADLVQELFGRVKVIGAHDTRGFRRAYGWPSLVVPVEYEMIHYNKGCGTTFWVHKDLADLITHLRKYL